MAARLNTRFIIILVVAAVVLVAGGIVGYTIVNKTGADWAQAAREAEQIGDWEAAIRHWERAVGHEHGNVDWLRAWREAYGHIVPENKQKAMETYFEIRQINGAIATARPDDIAVQEEWFDYQLRGFERLPTNTESWVELGAGVEDILHYLGDPLERGYAVDSPEETEYCSLLRFLAIARLEQMSRIETPADVRRQIRADLERCLRNRPHDSQVATSLAQWHTLEAERLLTDRRPVDSNDAWQRGTEVLEQFAAANPDNTIGLTSLALRLQQDARRALQQGGISPEEAAAIQLTARERSLAMVQHATDLLRQTPERRSLLILSAPNGLQVLLDPQAGNERALEVAELGLEHEPNNTSLLFRKAEILRRLGHFDESVATLQRIVDLPTPAVGLDALVIFQERPAAILQQFNTVMERWRRASDAESKEQALQQAQEIRTAYLPNVSSVTEDAAMWMLDGQLAHAKGNHAEAVRLLQKARTAHSTFPASLHYVLADSLARRGQLGDAEEVLAEAFEEMSPMEALWPSVWATLVEYQRQLGMGDATCDTIEKVLQYYPTSSELAQQLMNVHQQVALEHNLQQRQNAFGPAMQLDPRRELGQRIRDAVDGEESLKDIEPLVRQLAEEYPDDLQAQLVEARFYQRLGEGYVDQAIAAYEDVLRLDPENRDAPMAIRFLRGANPVDLIIEDIQNSAELSPSQKLILIWRTYLDAGMSEEAEAALAQVRRLDPTNSDLIEIEFVTAVGAEDWETAWSWVTTARENNIDQVNGATFEARLKLAQGDAQAAITQLTQAIEISPLNTELYLIRAQAYRSIGNLAGAVADMQRAYASRPTDAQIAALLADVLRQRGEFEAALEVARPAHKRHPNDDTLTQIWLELERQAGDAQAVTKYLQRTYDESPDNLANARLFVTWLIDQSDFAGADAILQRLETLEPGALSTLSLRAAWHAAQGTPEDIDAGRDVYVRFLESAAPETITSRFYGELANYLLTHGREAEAADWLTASLPLQTPEAREVDMALGQVYFRTGRFEDAAAHYLAVIEQATAPSPASAEAANMVYIETLINLERTEEAMRRLQALTAKGPPTLGQCLLEAKIHERNGDTAKARQAYDRGVAAEPSNHFAYYQRALFNRSDESMLADVLADLARAIEIMPGYRPARELRIQVQYRNGNIEQAVNEQKQLVELFPRDMQLRKDYAANLASLGQNEEHLSVLMEGAELFPDEYNWLVQISNWHAARGNGERAMEYLRRAYEEVSNRNPVVGMYYAAILLWDGELQDAELSKHLLQRHAQELEGFVDYYLIDARASAALGNLEEANELMRRAWDLAKLDDRTVAQDSVFRWANSVTSLYPVDLEAALSLAESIIGTEVPPAVMLLYARHYADHVAGVDQRLIEVLKPVVANEAHQLRARVTGAMFLGSLYYRQEQFQETVDLYEDVLYNMIPPLQEGKEDLYPLARIECLNNIAYIYADVLGKPELAEDPAREAERLRPLDANVLDTLGHVLFLNGKLGEAKTVLSRSLALEEMPANLLHMTEVLIGLGEYDQAWIYIRKAQLKIKPNQTDYLEHFERLQALLLEAEARAGDGP